MARGRFDDELPSVTLVVLFMEGGERSGDGEMRVLGESFSKSADVLDGGGFGLVGNGDFSEIGKWRKMTFGALF